MPDQTEPHKSKQTAAAATSVAPAAKPADAQSQATTRFADALNNYMKRLGEGWESARRGVEDSCRQFADAQRTAQADVDKSYADQARQYATELDQAARGPTSAEERQRALAAVYQKFQSSAHDLLSTTIQHSWSVRGELHQAITGSRKSYEDLCKAAFKSFLGELKKAWQAVDVEQLDAATLASIHQIANQAASYARLTGAL